MPATNAVARPISVKVTNLRKEFRRRGGEKVVAIDDVSLDIEAGQLVILLGPSGCGKTTLLRCIAGLEQPDSGRIEINGHCVYDSDSGILVPTERRDISMMFQSYALWPHMTAFENVEYAIRSRGKGRAEAAERSSSILKQMQIANLRDQYPAQMSGGQQQRVALARSLAVDPEVVLFDEPLSNVDAKVRDQLRLELVLMQRRVRFSGVYVTHDQIEALQLADLVAVMGHGRIHQLGSPREVYKTPASKYVATFVGQTNEIAGTVSAVATGGKETSLVVATPLGTVHCLAGGGAFSAGDAVSLIIRPENLRLSGRANGGAANCWQATLEATIFSGTYSEYRLQAGGIALNAWSTESDEFSDRRELFVSVDPASIHVFRQ